MTNAVPVPPRASGFVLGSKDADVVIDCYIAFQCPFAKKAWPKMLALYEECKKNVGIVFHPFIQTGHRQEFEINRTVMIVAGRNGDLFVKFASYLFEHSNDFSNDTFKDKTWTDLIDVATKLAVDFSAKNGIELDATTFLKKFNSSEYYYGSKDFERIRVLNRVWSSPSYFVNGVEALKVGSSTSVEEWKAYVESLVAGSM